MAPNERRKRKQLGIAFIADPAQDEGLVYTKSPTGEGGKAPRTMGTYTVTRRYVLMGRPMMAVNVNFDSGHSGYGKKRADQPGFVDVFARVNSG